MAFEIQFSPRAKADMKSLRKRDQQVVLDAIENQLRHLPDRCTRNRKPLAENPLAPWELRVGDFRVLYDVMAVDKIVVIVAVGRKLRNILRIGDEEVQL